MASTATAPAARKRRIREEGGRFRLLRGMHIDKPPTEDCECDSCVRTGGKEHVYEPNDVVVSDVDLEKRFNFFGRPEDDSEKHRRACNNVLNGLDWKNNRTGRAYRKFERLAEGQDVPKPPADYPLERMSFQQLLTVAAERKIEVKDVTKKDDLLKLLKS